MLAPEDELKAAAIRARLAMPIADDERLLLLLELLWLYEG